MTDDARDRRSDRADPGTSDPLAELRRHLSVLLTDGRTEEARETAMLALSARHPVSRVVLRPLSGSRAGEPQVLAEVTLPVPEEVRSRFGPFTIDLSAEEVESAREEAEKELVRLAAGEPLRHGVTWAVSVERAAALAAPLVVVALTVDQVEPFLQDLTGRMRFDLLSDRARAWLAQNHGQKSTRINGWALYRAAIRRARAEFWSAMVEIEVKEAKVGRMRAYERVANFWAVSPATVRKAVGRVGKSDADQVKGVPAWLAQELIYLPREHHRPPIG